MKKMYSKLTLFKLKVNPTPVEMINNIFRLVMLYLYVCKI